MAKTKAQLDRDIAINISDRRIAALRANGEDKRNTPAWRDAMDESRALRFNPSNRLGPVGERRRATPSLGGGRPIIITWYVIPNENKTRGGFMPVYSLHGKQRGNTYGYSGYDKATAERMAEEMAREEGARYVGDWNVTVKKGP